MKNNLFMKSFFLFIFFITFSSYAQNSSILKYEFLKEKINEKKIDLDKIDFSSEIINETEISILEILNNSVNNFENKEITFITGSAGKTISKKTNFFDSFKNGYFKKHIISFSINKLEEKERLLSGSDYIIFFWVKIGNPKSKKLLKKLKKQNTQNETNSRNWSRNNG